MTQEVWGYNAPVDLSSCFTGKERDSESGLDNFGARYYSSNMGRFMSPDWASKPEAVPYSSLSDPQTLNLYRRVAQIWRVAHICPTSHIIGCPMSRF